MQYFLYPLILLAYFELLGRALIYNFKIKSLAFSFPLGFVVILAISYLVTWPFTLFNMSFNSLFFVYVLLFLISSVLIFKNIKHILYLPKFSHLLILFVFFVIEFFISWNRTLGHVHGFDSIFYLNFVNSNIGTPALNSTITYFGTPANTPGNLAYIFQSYYFIVAAVIFVCREFLNYLNVSFDTVPAFAWGFQIIFHFFQIALTIIIIDELKIKNKMLIIGLFCLNILFLGNFYYNNVFGFFGNSYRCILHAFAYIYLYRYFKDKKSIDLYIFYVVILAICSVSSSGIFSIIFLLFGLFFILISKRKYLLFEYGVVLLIPIINLFIFLSNGDKKMIFVGIIFSLILFCLNIPFRKVFFHKKIRIFVIILASLCMMLSSLYVTKDFFNFDAFFNNWSEVADMTWDYFAFHDFKHILYNSLLLGSFSLFCSKHRDDDFAKIFIILIVVLFNPFSCSIINHFNKVYYRSYDIMINQFTILYVISVVLNEIKILRYKKIASISIVCVALPLSFMQVNSYYHSSFIPNGDFNHIHKIQSSELSLIRNINELIEKEGIVNPRIINASYYMQSYIDNCSVMYGREKRFNWDDPMFKDENFKLYTIFFPYDNVTDQFAPSEAPQREKTDELLKNSNYNILIVSNWLHYTDESGNSIPVTYLIKDFEKSEYSTIDYSVYLLKTDSFNLLQ